MQLLRNGRIRTTRAKAKEVEKTAAHTITLAKAADALEKPSDVNHKRVQEEAYECSQSSKTPPAPLHGTVEGTLQVPSGLSEDGVDEPDATHLQQALPHVKKQLVL